MKDFKQLEIWQEAYRFTLEIYRLTKGFPDSERYGLSSQIRRASTSIISNIAEGCGRDGDAELKRFLIIAMGSASEVECQLMLSKDLQYIDSDHYQQLHAKLSTIKRRTNAFIQKLKASP